MGTRISFLGWYRPGIRHPPLFLPYPSMTATSSATFGDRDRRASTAATGRRIVPSITESRLGRAWGCFLGRVSIRWRTRLRSAINSGKFSEQEPPSSRDQPCRTRSRRRFRRGFAAGRAAFGDSTALFIPVLEKSPNSRIGKAKGFRRFLVV